MSGYKIWDDLARLAAFIIEATEKHNLKWMYGGFILVTAIHWFFTRQVLAATDRWPMRLALRLGLAVFFFLGQFLVAYVTLGQPILEPVLKEALLLSGRIFS